MDQQLSFNFIEETKINASVMVPVDVPAYPFEDMFVNIDGITEMHSNKSMAVLGDSLEVLRKIKSNSVKLIFADAPYNIPLTQSARKNCSCSRLAELMQMMVTLTS